MPALFTPLTPVKYVEFNFMGLIDSFGKQFGHLSFFPQWKKYWLDSFLDLDEQIKDYVKEFPNSNPIIQRIKAKPSVSLDNYELFQFEHITDYGIYTFHFDVEAMNIIKNNSKIPLETVKLNDLYIDPDTPVLKSKLEDRRKPLLVRMFGIEKAFICADGNKRLKIRIENGEDNFKCHIFYPQNIEDIFFGPLDLYYYTFLHEIEYMHRQILDHPNDEKAIFNVTQLYLQAQQWL
ncbi:hypothetical protein F7984_10740 [Pradoshia sp. D12]|uniref:hypothetical protein n=1 Tax=Bacillaceae TaxID=186817 RepID=UPI0011299133|nr:MULTISPECIES: hypothetical protein [Bacillaceae]QFK71671.1 hypothetical protein F7984_10740 [Pradoshia sp. D12]TPF73466.1 hypothetical protein FHY44_07140 [Bacillus sp. D12]